MSGGTKRWMPLALISITVALQLVAAGILNHAARMDQRSAAIAGIAIGSAIALHMVRFVIWGYAHRRFPLSHTYPLTALFFPLVLVLSYFQGDYPEPENIIGVALITLGVGLLAFNSNQQEPVS